MMKLDILVFAAHPDDVELACSGTLLHHIKNGSKVGIIDLTQGELGSRGSAALRMIEAGNSSKILGLTVRENLGFRDGFFVNDEAHRLKIIEKIRQYQPELILANAPCDRHPDHGRGSELVKEACFYSGLRMIHTEMDGKSQLEWRPTNLLFYIQDQYIKPDLLFDITPYWQTKLDSILAFSSQFYSGEDDIEPKTPISSKSFFMFLEARARDFGRPIGVEFAEGFVKSRDFGVNDLFSLL